MLLYEVTVCHAGLGSVSMHITPQPHFGDITQVCYTLPGFGLHHAIYIPLYLVLQLSQASIFQFIPKAVVTNANQSLSDRRSRIDSH